MENWITIGQAMERTGRSRSSILKAAKAGHILYRYRRVSDTAMRYVEVEASSLHTYISGRSRQYVISVPANELEIIEAYLAGRGISMKVRAKYKATEAQEEPFGDLLGDLGPSDFDIAGAMRDED